MKWLRSASDREKLRNATSPGRGDKYLDFVVQMHGPDAADIGKPKSLGMDQGLQMYRPPAGDQCEQADAIISTPANTRT